MTTTNFTDFQTPILASWLNDVDEKTYNDNAQLMQYTPAGTGAVETTVQSKLRESVSVLDFGASTTNTASQNDVAIQAAFDSDAGDVYIPEGTYLVTELILPQSKVIHGSRRSILQGTDSTKYVLRFDGAGPPYSVNGVIKNLTITGIYSRALSLSSYSAEIYAKHLRLDGAASDCQIYTSDSFCSQFDHIKITGSYVNAGWKIGGGSNSLTINSLYISQGGGPYGVDISGLTTPITNSIVFNGPAIENATCAIRIGAAVGGVTINSLYTENVGKVMELGESGFAGRDVRGLVVNGGFWLWTGNAAVDLYNVTGGSFNGVMLGSTQYGNYPTGVFVGAVGSGYTNGESINITASDGSGTGALGTAQVNGSGQLVGVLVTSGGSGYTNGEAVTLNAVDGTGTSATGNVYVVGGVVSTGVASFRIWRTMNVAIKQCNFSSGHFGYFVRSIVKGDTAQGLSGLRIEDAISSGATVTYEKTPTADNSHFGVSVSAAGAYTITSSWTPGTYV